jgi:hypothetical protein
VTKFKLQELDSLSPSMYSYSVTRFDFPKIELA